MRPSYAVALILVAGLSGCRLWQEPNPDDANQVSASRQPDLILRHMKHASDVVNDQVWRNKIDDATGRKLLLQDAQQYMNSIRLKNISANDAWKIAQAYLTAQQWDKAEHYLGIALQNPPDQDRRINDTLRFARCQAELGDVPAAIITVRSLFDAPPEWKWPILYAVYLEIVPAAAEKNPDMRIELAQLVRDAIHQHLLATGNARDPRFTNLIFARTHHVVKAWQLVDQLYADAKRPDLARAAANQEAADVKASEALTPQTGRAWPGQDPLPPSQPEGKATGM